MADDEVEEPVDWLEVGTRFALFIGVMVLGLALGAHLGLRQLQVSCIEAGGLPPVGTPLASQEQLHAWACWEGAKRMQMIANTSARIGGALLIAGGVADRFDEEIRERGALLRERLSA